MLTRVLFLNAGSCSQLGALAGRRSWGLTRFYAPFVYLEHPRHGACLIDTGYGPWFWESTRRWPGRLMRWLTPVRLAPRREAGSILQARGLKPDCLSRIFVSHFHADHIGGLRHFPKTQFVYRRAAHEQLLAEKPRRQLKNGFLVDLLPGDFTMRGEAIEEAAFRQGTAALQEFRVLDYWGDGSLLMVDLPGHALGHTGYVLRTAGRALFYIVDACWDLDVLLQGRGLPRLSREVQNSYEVYRDTQQRLRRLAEQDAYRLLACHCPRTQEYVAKDED